MADPALLQPVTALKGVGPRQAERCARLGLRLVRDLLFHLPLRYEDRTQVTPLGALRPGTEALIEATVELAQVQFGRRRSLLVRVADGTGGLLLRFFHFNAAQQQALARGARLRGYGEVRAGSAGLEMIHPEYRLLAPGVAPPVEAALTPVYPTTEGLHQLSLRRLTDQALERLDGAGAQDATAARLDAVVADAARRLGLGEASLAQALRCVHRPATEADIPALLARRHPAQRRLAFEELLAHHLSLRRARAEIVHRRAPALAGPGALGAKLCAALPFALTGAQARACAEIGVDIARPVPMLRLLQGDVGSGKTVVAALTLLRAIELGYQAAIMAPTELLAEQHLRNLRRWFEPLGVPVLWLSGKLTRAQREATIAAVRETPGAAIVGTHALFQEAVAFRDLALVVIDEQHRFGVHQRLQLRDKGRGDHGEPHQLVMTATPIPRTLAMTAYADLDVSVIDELPPDRQPIQTSVVPDSRRAEIVERIAAATRAGRQAYWVCTLIEESDALQCQAATETAAILAGTLPGVRVGLVHGRLKDREKEAVMTAFLAHEIDLLVATTVIEVGVDVPNASLMIIENAERLGLAQLHQLRGRVGRGSRASDCVLLYRAPLSHIGRERLATMRETTDGFVIAQRDLELRGPGELLGTRQAGLAGLRIADLARDGDLLDEVAAVAARLLDTDHAAADLVVERWLGAALGYADA